MLNAGIYYLYFWYHRLCILVCIKVRVPQIAIFELINYRIVGDLGSGEFGSVYEGRWHSPGGSINVAIKTLKYDSDEGDRVRFLQEAAIMGQFHHPNIVKLHGVITMKEPVSWY